MKELAPKQLAVLKYPNFRLKFATIQKQTGSYDALALQVAGVFLLRRKCIS